MDNFQKDTLDVLLEEQAQAKWKPNPLDLQPGVDPSILDDVTGINETANKDIDTQPRRKPTGESYAERGHHPEWADARRIQQAGFWGPYTPSIAATRETVAEVADIDNSEDDWSEGSIYDGGHPWDAQHDQGWARPRLGPSPKTQWRQRAERKEMDHIPDRSPDAYWDPDRWDPEYERMGTWLLPEEIPMRDASGYEMKMLPVGMPQSETNKYVKPLTRENLLLWIDYLDGLDPVKKMSKSIEWIKQNADRRTLSWMDQFNPPDYTEFEWKDEYDEDTRYQWEDVQTIHPKDWKAKHQSGNSLPLQHDVNFAAWKAKYSGKKKPDGDPSLPYSDKGSTPPPGDLPSAVSAAKDNDGNKGPDPDSEARGPDEMFRGQRVALVAGGITAGVALLGTLGLLVGWGWKRITKAKKDKTRREKRAQRLGNSTKNAEIPISSAPVKSWRNHPRHWKKSTV